MNIFIAHADFYEIFNLLKLSLLAVFESLSLLE